jgi:hypothetical protein
MGDFLKHWNRTLAAATVAALAASMLFAGTPAYAAENCVAQDDPTWAAMRAEAENLVSTGEMTREKADAYKCNPELIIADIKASVENGDVVVEVTPLPPLEEEENSPANADIAAAAKTKCLDQIGLTYKVGTPVTLTAFQSLNWCFNGTKVSDWSGECYGTVSKWGKANFWSFDSCSQNDFIPYKIGKKKNGGIHHKTRINFVNKVPWTFDLSFLLEQWGHYDGGLDQMVDGKFVGVSKGKN